MNKKWLKYSQLSASGALLTARFAINAKPVSRFNFETRKKLIASLHAFVISAASISVLKQGKWATADLISTRDEDAVNVIRTELIYLLLDILAEGRQSIFRPSRGIILHHVGISIGLSAYWIASIQEADKGVFFVLIFLVMNMR